MAGGTGERFWPLGRRSRPKQLLKITNSGKTLMQESIERAKAVFDEQDIYVVTSSLLAGAIGDDLRDYPKVNIVAEPQKRNTAPCLVFSAAYVSQQLGLSPENISMAVLTADHIIEPVESFAADAEKCLAFVERGGSIATLGIKPNYPATGFGYIQAGEMKGELRESKGFVEKPDLTTAQSYLESGDYYWNSGMFFWRLDYFLETAKKNYENSIDAFKVMENGLKEENNEVVESAFVSLEPTSIDYAVMEKAENVYVLPASFNWQDAGSLDVLESINKPDKLGNSTTNRVLTIESK
ncbi:MAG: mannose-1-phosphate guanylyltransferase [Candidatus Kapaibacteriales bacterium]